MQSSRWVGFAALLLVISQSAIAEINPFVVVLIDAKTEKEIGPFPYDRSVYAKAIERAASLGAEGVALKFFLDLPKSPDGDRALADSMKATKVLLEARIDNAEAHPNPLPTRFCLPGLGPMNRAIGGTSGWLPLPILASAAAGVGFVDARTVVHPPMIEQYRDRYVKSLWLCCLEMAMRKTAQIEPGKRIRLGDKTLPMNGESEVVIAFPKSDQLNYIPFCDFLSSGAPSVEVKRKVVIIGYIGDKAATVATPPGEMQPHRAFCLTLFSLYARLKQK